MILGGVEKKAYGALIMLSDKDNMAHATMHQIAIAMGYKQPGGVITYALKSLEYKNHIVVIEKNRYKVML